MTDENRFPLSKFDTHKVEKVIQLIRGRLAAMSPIHLRTASSALLALEQLPQAAPGINVVLGFWKPRHDGKDQWIALSISEREFVLTVHGPYDGLEVVGDTETRTVFESHRGDKSNIGDIKDWLNTADSIVSENRIVAEDYSDHDTVDWFPDDDDIEDVASGEESCSTSNGDEKEVSSEERDQLRRIFEEASGPMKEPIRDQMAYRHMIALADFFEGWALGARTTPEQSAKLVGWAESLRRLADDVGPDWEPPTPDRLTLMGFVGRKALGE